MSYETDIHFDTTVYPAPAQGLRNKTPCKTPETPDVRVEVARLVRNVTCPHCRETPAFKLAEQRQKATAR